MIGGLITFLIMLWVLYSIYLKGYKPLKDRVMMYADKQIQASKIDVTKIVDDTLSHFEKTQKEVK